LCVVNINYMKIKDVNSIYFGIERSDKNSIVSSSKFWKPKKMYITFADYFVKYMHDEYKWSIKADFAKIIEKECKSMSFLKSIVLYHEIVEYLVTNGSEDSWDYSHPIAVEITSNKLKKHIPELTKFSNIDIYEAEFYTTFGQLETGNPFLDNSRYAKKREELSKKQIQIVAILNKSYKPLFLSTLDLFNDLIADR
jgi:hypothetical protein